MNRRRLLEFFGLAAVSSAAAAAPVEAAAGVRVSTTPPLPVGTIIPRITHTVTPMFPHRAVSPMQSVRLVEYVVWTGSRWVDVHSAEGNEIHAALLRMGGDGA